MPPYRSQARNPLALADAQVDLQMPGNVPRLMDKHPQEHSQLRSGPKGKGFGGKLPATIS